MSRKAANRALRRAEKQARADRLQVRALELREAGAMFWKWPGTGNDGDLTAEGKPLPRNCWDTGLPAFVRQKNAHKCNFTQLPGSANGRNKRRRRALAGSSYRKAQAHDG